MILQREEGGGRSLDAVENSDIHSHVRMAKQAGSSRAPLRIGYLFTLLVWISSETKIQTPVGEYARFHR